MAASAHEVQDDEMMRMFDGFLDVFEQATTPTVSNWNRRTYKTAKGWGAYAQKAVAMFASPAQVAALDRAFVEASRARGFKVELDCGALAGAPSLLMRTLLLNRYTPDTIMPEIWRDLAAEQPPAESAVLDVRGNRAFGADVLREELERARRLDARLDAADAISSVLEAAAGAASQAGFASTPAAPTSASTRLGSMPLATYRSAQMLVSGRLLHDDLCRVIPSETELDAFVRDKVLRYASADVPCLELLGWVLLARPDAAHAHDEGAAARAAVSRAMSARLHSMLLEYMLSAEQRERVWRLHPWLLAAMSEAHFAVCAAYSSHLLVQTAAALRRLQAHLALPRHPRAALGELREPIEPADDELMSSLCRRWAQLLLRGGLVGAFCAKVLAEFKQSCGDELRTVLDAAIFSRLLAQGVTL